jgi:mannose-6-phosphate isomerase-like protein (cupin superfamily)
MTQPAFGWQLVDRDGGVPTAPSRTILFGNDRVILSLLNGGASEVSAHLHASHDEFGCMLEGAGQLWIGTQVLALRPGATWAIPQGTPHRAVFTATFRIVAWLTPWDDPDRPDRVDCMMPGPG